MSERTAQCACGRLQVRTSGEPEQVLACHCEFCQRRSGSAYPVVAWFDRSQVMETIGESHVYNGLEIDGVGGAAGQGTSYHFCPTCGSTVFWTFDTIPDVIPAEYAETMARVVVVPVGAFADPGFPPPQAHLFPELTPTWLVTHGAG